MTDQEDRRIVACRSDADLAEIGGITILGSAKFGGTLRAAVVGDDADKRAALITAVRAGEHVELLVNATTFRQKDGVMNRKKTRLAAAALDATARTFVGMPVLVDHNQWSQSSRIGTITSSELSMHGGTGWASFNQQLKIVKPEAVISVLDGTIDRFSIGWLATGPVMCSVHGVDVRGSDSCYCWPGDSVMTDGKSQTVEFVFTSAEGIEVSAVNVPAVKGTKVDDIRTALALELDIRPRSAEPARTMNFTKLMAALSLATLASPEDDARAAEVVEGLRRGRLAAEQERDTARGERDTARAELATAQLAATNAEKAGRETRVKSMLDGAYRDGKLLFSRSAEDPTKVLASPREERLRRIAAEPNGLAALEAELAEMPVLAPVGLRAVNPGDRQPPREQTLATGPGSGDPTYEAALGEAMRQQGLKPEDVAAAQAQINKRRAQGNH